MKKIAIIGATGMLGQPVTRAFIDSGYEVSILARNISKADTLFGASVNIVPGDLQDLKSIREFLKGHEALYLNLSVEQHSNESDFQPERDGLQQIMLACRNSGIRRIGYLSSLIHQYQEQNGFDWWAFEIKKNAVREIKAGSPAYSIFYPSTFMECFDKGPYRQGNKINLAGKSKYPMYFISGRDYAKQVVRAFELDDGDNHYTIQGTEAYLVEEAANLFAQNYRKAKIRIIKLPFALLKFFGRLSKRFNYASHIVEALNNYPEKFDAEKTWAELGRPETRFIEYSRNA
jgi:nucleoside-diphosphate-sugar epimerase